MNESNEHVNLQQLFEQAEQELEPETFIRDTLDRVDQHARRRRRTWIGIGAVVVLIELFLLDFAAGFSATLSTSLLDMGEGNLAQFLQPLNSVAGLLAVLVLFSQRFLQRLQN